MQNKPLKNLHHPNRIHTRLANLTHMITYGGRITRVGINHDDGDFCMNIKQREAKQNKTEQIAVKHMLPVCYCRTGIFFPIAPSNAFRADEGSHQASACVTRHFSPPKHTQFLLAGHSEHINLVSHDLGGVCQCYFTNSAPQTVRQLRVICAVIQYQTVWCYERRA